MDALVGAMGTSDTELRRLIVGELARCALDDRIARGLSRLSADAVEPLIEAVKLERTPYRRLLTSILGRVGDERAVEVLIGLLEADDWRIRARAAAALRRSTDPRAVDALSRAATDASEPVRGAARR